MYGTTTTTPRTCSLNVRRTTVPESLCFQHKAHCKHMSRLLFWESTVAIFFRASNNNFCSDQHDPFGGWKHQLPAGKFHVGCVEELEIFRDTKSWSRVIQYDTSSEGYTWFANLKGEEGIHRLKLTAFVELNCVIERGNLLVGSSSTNLGWTGGTLSRRMSSKITEVDHWPRT
jgi:hypothetical protein